VTLLAIVSGRGVADLQSRVDLPNLTYIGNHGLERWIDGAAHPLPEAEAYRPALQAVLQELPTLPGVDFEDKGATLTVHYRLADDPQQAAQTLAPLLKNLAAQHGLRFSEGKMVFELKPPIEINKGTAFHELVTAFRLDGALFLGDDTTDLDALQAAQSLRADQSCYALGIGVESADMPPDLHAHADLLVSGPLDVEAFLGWLLDSLSRRAS
jgi:trehalose 6-phosphate phosphatase